MEIKMENPEDVITCEEVAISIVQQYYSRLCSSTPEDLLQFYAKDTVFSMGEAAREFDAPRTSSTLAGESHIKERIKKLHDELGKFKVRVCHMDQQPGLHHSVLVMVSGYFLFDAPVVAARRFYHTMLLVPNSGAKNGITMYIKNDCLRFFALEDVTVVQEKNNSVSPYGGNQYTTRTPPHNAVPYQHHSSPSSMGLPSSTLSHIPAAGSPAKNNSIHSSPDFNKNKKNNNNNNNSNNNSNSNSHMNNKNKNNSNNNKAHNQSLTGMIQSSEESPVSMAAPGDASSLQTQQIHSEKTTSVPATTHGEDVGEGHSKPHSPTAQRSNNKSQTKKKQQQQQVHTQEATGFEQNENQKDSSKIHHDDQKDKKAHSPRSAPVAAAVAEVVAPPPQRPALKSFRDAVTAPPPAQASSHQGQQVFRVGGAGEALSGGTATNISSGIVKSYIMKGINAKTTDDEIRNKICSYFDHSVKVLDIRNKAALKGLAFVDLDKDVMANHTEKVLLMEMGENKTKVRFEVAADSTVSYNSSTQQQAPSQYSKQQNNNNNNSSASNQRGGGNNNRK